MKRIYMSFVLILLLIDLRFIAAQGSDEIRQLSWSPNGQILAIAKADGTVLLWNEQNLQQLGKLVGYSGDFSDLAWSPDSNQLITSSDDRTARVWDVETGKSIFTIEGLGRSYSKVTWSPDGKVFAISNFEGADNLIVRNATTGEVEFNSTVQTPSQMGWSSDGTRFAIILPYAGTIFIWNSEFTISTWVATANVVSDASTGFAWHPSANTLVLGTASATIQVIDAVKSERITQYKTTDATINADDPFAHATIKVAFSADGSEIMSANADGTVRKWNEATGEMISSTQIDVAKTTYTPYPIVDWSPYRGRMIYLSDDTPTDASSETDLAALGVKIVTPFASDEQLRSLVNLCVEETAAKSDLESLITAKNYAEIVDTVKALPSDQVPSACAADLVAVAETLQQEG
jgi:WD40 repeat protein